MGVSGTGTGAIAVRGYATTLADASNFADILEKMNIHVKRSKGVR